MISQDMTKTVPRKTGTVFLLVGLGVSLLTFTGTRTCSAVKKSKVVQVQTGNTHGQRLKKSSVHTTKKKGFFEKARAAVSRHKGVAALVGCLVAALVVGTVGWQMAKMGSWPFAKKSEQSPEQSKEGSSSGPAAAAYNAMKKESNDGVEAPSVDQASEAGKSANRPDKQKTVDYVGPLENVTAEEHVLDDAQASMKRAQQECNDMQQSVAESMTVVSVTQRDEKQRSGEEGMAKVACNDGGGDDSERLKTISRPQAGSISGEVVTHEVTQETCDLTALDAGNTACTVAKAHEASVIDVCVQELKPKKNLKKIAVLIQEKFKALGTTLAGGAVLFDKEKLVTLLGEAKKKGGVQVDAAQLRVVLAGLMIGIAERAEKQKRGLVSGFVTSRELTDEKKKRDARRSPFLRIMKV